jgi:holo-[acyl-carrier protein] synthase
VTEARAPGIGIDLIEIERVERALERRPGLERRLFRAGEIEYSRSSARPGKHFAARFAAKEAALKALGETVAPRDIEVVGSAPPRLLLHGRAAESAARAGLRLDVSLTHSRELAGAVVTATRAG